MSNEFSTDDMFKICDLYFKQNNIMYSHLHHSYDKFLDDDLKTFLEGNNNIFYESVNNNKSYTHKFVYSDIAIRPPSNEDGYVMPSDARTRNLTYSCKITATVTQVQEIIDMVTDETTVNVIGTPEVNYPIGTISMMVRSKYCSLNVKKDEDKTECEYDSGGYFIINGLEKVVLALERMVENKPLVFSKKDSTSGTRLYSLQINSKSYITNMVQIVNIKMKKDNTLHIKVPILQEVPVFVLMKALGIESDKDIVSYCVYDMNDHDMINIVRNCLDNLKYEKSETLIQTQEEAILYLIRKMKVYKKYKYSETDTNVKIQQKKLHLEQLLNSSFLPHIEGSLRKKAYFLGHMINRLLQCYLGRIKTDDRDSFVNKRIDLPGSLLFELFKQTYKKMLNECSKFFAKRNDNDKEPINIISQIKDNIIEQGIKNALSSGNWGKRKGVSQMLQRGSYLYTGSSMRRINSPTADASTNKLTGPRHLHSSQVGFICYIETPEGQKVGLVKNLSLMGNITIMLSSQIFIIRSLLQDKYKEIEDIKANEIKNYTKVLLNGEWLGLTNKPKELYDYLRSKKLSGEIDNKTSIVLEIKSEIESKELKIYCEGGRIFRPILRTENNKLLLTREQLDSISIEEYDNATKITRWNDFLLKYPGVIEYIDADEQANAILAATQNDLNDMSNRMINSIDKIQKLNYKGEIIVNRHDNFKYVKYNYCEIHPTMSIGSVVCNIPFCNSNQAPRNMYQFSQARQAMGIYVSNYRYRMDISYILYHPQRPLVTTRCMKYVNSYFLPAGENLVVAIASYTGYNQEDSVILNKSGLDRGMMIGSKLDKYSSIISKNQSTSQDDVFMKPDPAKVLGLKPGSYDKLNDDGYAPEETYIVDGDIIISKLSPINPTGNSTKTMKDNSEVYKSHVPGVIDKVDKGIYNNEGYEIRKIRVRSERIPTIGDKFCCYSPDTEVLTKTGWVYFDKLTKEHQVATLHNDTIVYEHPMALQKYDHNDDMYYVKTEDVDLCVTLNHHMYVSRDNINFELVQAQYVDSNTAYYKKTFNDEYKGTINNNSMVVIDGTSELPHINCKINDFLALYALLYYKCSYIHRVLFIKDNNIDNYLINIVNEKIPEILMNDDMITDARIINYYLNNLENNDWIWELSGKLCKKLLMYLIPYRHFVPYYDRLCFHAGLYYNTNKNIIECKNKFIVNNLILDDNICKNIFNQVYCCTVSTGIIYVRRNGVAVFCGNSRAGQKGVCGNKLTQADMMFNKQGISADCVISPNAIPSRMTIGQLIECVAGKAAALQGMEIDSTPFENPDVESIKTILKKYNFEENGYEYMYNGMTGARLKVPIFVGPTYYLRLKHMVNDKIHCLTLDHMVLTNNGWKYFNQLNINYDLVATLDNGILKYDVFKKLYFSSYSGNMYNCNQLVDFNVTSKHKLYIKNDNNNNWELKEIDNIENSVTMKKNCINDIVDLDPLKSNNSDDLDKYHEYIKNIDFDFKYGIYDILSSIELIGYYIIFGNIYYSVISINNPHVTRCLDKLNINYDCTNNFVTILDKYIVNYLNNIVGIPKWIFNLSQDKCLYLVKLITDKTFVTSCNIMADDYSRLCLHAGLSCDIKIENNMFYCEINEINEPIINNIEKYQVNDIPVFCLTVPSGIFYVRRNGIPSWTGNSRARGPSTTLTRQAPEGRSREGGLRFGEMERDCIISHGMGRFLKERMLETADAYSVHICNNCGLFAQRMIRRDNKKYITKRDMYHCPPCNNKTHIYKIRIPYAFKLLIHEMMAMNIAPRIKVKTNKFNN